ncbi:MAG TPA: type II toxin-antitoxin system VapC family toxin [Candidatus Limnocylindrales bacterium]|nr:type II toxin-antitoxin system VapC family toxin [Candidatus Limnocylindrales bacterium]
MNYLLDTNACIALMAPDPNRVQARFARSVGKADRFFTSSVVTFELWYGVFKSSRKVENTRRCETFFSGPIDIVPLEESAAKIGGEIRAVLEAAGRPIGAYDLLLAAQAIHYKMTLITANVSEFSRVKGLDWEDWS